MGSPASATEVDVLVIGAGVTGIYQLHRAVEAGFSALLLEAGDGPGGVWHWNRYPGARLDSESFTYGYFFSQELYDEWRWSEHFAGQPENESYFKFVVERTGLAERIRFGARVLSTVWDEESGTWTVRAGDDSTVRARFVVAATGVLSIPVFPSVPGREDFEGASHHTGQWPTEPIDFAGKRVAVVGTGSSGVQVIPAIADVVESLTVYQRTPNWCTPLNNTPIDEAQQEQLRSDFERIKDVCETSASGFMHVSPGRRLADDTPEERQAHFERMWASPGFSKLTTNYIDITTDPAANAAFSEFLAGKIRELVDDPEVAEQLIPDHPFAAKRPPFVTNYFETFNRANVELVSLLKHPMTRVTRTGIETADGHREFDIIVWASGFDFGTGALNRLGVRGRDGLPLEQHWNQGPSTFLGLAAHGYPNFFFPGGPHGASGNNPRYAGEQVDHVHDVLVHARAAGVDVVEVDQAAEDEWTTMMDTYAAYSPFSDISYFYGSNVPGKPVRNLLNSAGRLKMREVMATAAEAGYRVYGVQPQTADTPV